MSAALRPALEQGIATLGLTLSAAQVDLLLDFLALLKK